MEILALDGGIHEEANTISVAPEECGKIDVQTFRFHCVWMSVWTMKICSEMVADHGWKRLPTN